MTLIEMSQVQEPPPKTPPPIHPSSWQEWKRAPGFNKSTKQPVSPSLCWRLAGAHENTSYHS